MSNISKFIIIFFAINIIGCANKNINKFTPTIGGKCLDSQSVNYWEGSKSGDAEKPSNPLVRLSDNAIRIVTIIPMYFLDVGHLATYTTGLLLGSMPQCGNWCGAGFPLPTENPPAIDPLDEACRKHDLCYRKKGLYDCQCDQELAYEVLRGRGIFELSLLELKIVAFFRASFCENGCKQIAGTKNCSNRYEN